MRQYKRTRQVTCAALVVFLLWTYGQFRQIPTELVMVRGQAHSLPTFVAPHTEGDNFLWQKNGRETAVWPMQTGSFSLEYTTLGLLRKTATVHVVEPQKVSLGGEAVGIKMYMEGVLVVALSEIPGTGRAPGKEGGIQVGDRILSVNGTPLPDSDALERAVEESRGAALTLSVCRGEKKWETAISPVYYPDAERYKLGLWVRDSEAGIGTITFSLPESGKYAALGHAIADADTGTRVSAERGTITDCKIVYIEKGEDGAPGAIRGVFGEDVGSIGANTDYGLYGTLYAPESGKMLPLAVSTQVKKGEAVIYSDIAGGAPEAYTIEIERVWHRKNPGSKSMVLRITDERLLALTGGIIQGMSGSPIVQDGRLVGAVTHVFVHDPTRGYGIFIENMLKETGDGSLS